MKKCILYRNKSLLLFVLFYNILLIILGGVDLGLNNAMYFSPIFLGICVVVILIIFLKTIYKFEFDNIKITKGFIFKRTLYFNDVDYIKSIKNGIVLFAKDKKLVIKLLSNEVYRENYEAILKTINENIPNKVQIDVDSKKLFKIGVDRFINSWDGNSTQAKQIAASPIAIAAIIIMGMATIVIESIYITQNSILSFTLKVISIIILALFFIFSIYLIVKLQNINKCFRILGLFKFNIPIIMYIVSKWFMFDRKNNLDITCMMAYALIIIFGLSIIISIILEINKLQCKKKEIISIEPKKIVDKQKRNKNTRKPNDKEKYWIQTILSNQTMGREVLLEQLDNSIVSSNYSNESITIKFIVNTEVNRFPYIRTAPFDVLAHQHDGTIIVMLLYVVNGYISELQIFNTELTKISADFTLDMIGTRQTTKVLH
jgi:hypothetical protein